MKEITEDQFYEAATRIVSESKNGKFATQSPALILPAERKSGWRKKYFDALLSAIQKNKINVKYLFHLNSTKELILESNKEEILNNWGNFLKHKNLDLRFTKENFESCIIGDKEVLFKKGEKRFLVSSDSKEGKETIKKFDNIFGNASTKNKEIIEEIQ